VCEQLFVSLRLLHIDGFLPLLGQEMLLQFE
jgi:hypothetical protein